MYRRLTDRAVRIALLLAALLALCAGGLALHQAGSGAGTPGYDLPAGASDAHHSAPDGAHLQASVEALDSEESLPVGFEHLNALALGLFLVSLGLLLGAGLAGRGADARLLELLRLPSVLPRPPWRGPLSALEVFRL